jgi:hypothetical protein
MVIDTLLNGHPVRISAEANTLMRGASNELRIDVDPSLGKDWLVFTKTREASIQIDTLNGKWLVTPTVSADSVSLFFVFTGPEGRRMEPERLILPTE